LGSILTVVFSLMLLLGVYKNVSFLMLPWLVQQIAELAIGAGLLVVYFIAGSGMTIGQVEGLIMN